MANNPIEGLVGESLNQIKQMLSINTIVGDPIHTPSGDTILPISRVGVGFVAGGSELKLNQNETAMFEHTNSLPFGGGSGGGVSITPIAFLVVGAQGVKVVPLDNQTHLFDKIIDSAPQLISKVSEALQTSSTTSATSTTSSTSGQSVTQQASDLGPNSYL